MKNTIIEFLRDERGLTTVEYAVAGALITVAVVTAFTTLGGSVEGTITLIDGALPG
ncbi:MAG TPA: Flp family type IVb pilin [Gammaproteobacteria bacterium]